MLGSCFVQNQSFAGKPLKKTSAILVLCGRCIVSSKLFQPYKTELILFQANTVKSISPLVHLLDYFWLFLFHNYPSNQADVLLFFYTQNSSSDYTSHSLLIQIRQAIFRSLKCFSDLFCTVGFILFSCTSLRAKESKNFIHKAV